MNKQLSKHLPFFACVTAIILSVTACGGSTPSNGGIPTEEQLSAAVDTLGDDLSSLKVSVDGVIYQFPMNVSDMTEAGWSFDSSAKSELKNIPANTLITPGVSMQKRASDGYGATSCSVQPANKSFSEVALEDAALYKVTFSESKGTTVILPGGFTWNSTFDEVKAVCNSEQVSDMNGIRFITIQGEDYHFSVKINFDSTDNTINTIEFSGRL